jgi:hypothetical protein
MLTNGWAFLLLSMTAATALAGCNSVNEQIAYRNQQRKDCAAAGGYFEENKIGSSDNYTCKGPGGGPTMAGPPPPTNCRTETSSVKRDDGSVETNTNQVCTSF